ncbi:MAG TPA: hypothetical protein VGM36_11455, partial [Rhizomicrobium sp.]
MSFKRVFATSAFLLALIASSTIAPISPAALAQSAPSAAPVGPVAESQPLDAPSAAPAGSVDVTTTGSTPDVGNISIVSLFWRADPLVKAVFVLLVAASLWSWTIIIGKWLMLGSLRRKADAFEKTFWSGLSLDELYQQFSPRP